MEKHSTCYIIIGLIIGLIIGIPTKNIPGDAIISEYSFRKDVFYRGNNA